VGTTSNRDSQNQRAVRRGSARTISPGWSGSTKPRTPASTTRTGASKTTRARSRLSPPRSRRTSAGKGFSCSRHWSSPGSSPRRSAPPRSSCPAGVATGRAPWPRSGGSSSPSSGRLCLAPPARGVLHLLHATEGNVILGGAAYVTAVGVLWLPVTRNWSPLCAAVLGVVHLPVRGLPGVRDRVDVRQRPRPGQHDRRRAAVVPRGDRRGDVLRLPVGTVRRARHRALAPPPAAA